MPKDSHMKVSRRGFLAGLGALAVAASLPASVCAQWSKDRVIRGQRFVLHEPMVFDFEDGLLITDCRFEAAPDFVGKWLLDLRNCKNVRITSCTLTGRGMPTRVSGLAI